MQYTFETHSREETVSFGLLLGQLVSRGDVVLLQGDLGAGKTTLVVGVAKALDVKEDVISPTFNIMKCYFKGKIPLYHIDAYRLEGQNIELGLDEFIEGDGVCFIEWPQFIAPLIPEEHLEITLLNKGGDSREITIVGEGPHFMSLIQKVEGKYHV